MIKELKLPQYIERIIQELAKQHAFPPEHKRAWLKGLTCLLYYGAGERYVIRVWDYGDVCSIVARDESLPATERVLSSIQDLPLTARGALNQRYDDDDLSTQILNAIGDILYVQPGRPHPVPDDIRCPPMGTIIDFHYGKQVVRCLRCREAILVYLPYSVGGIDRRIKIPATLTPTGRDQAPVSQNTTPTTKPIRPASIEVFRFILPDGRTIESPVPKGFKVKYDFATPGDRSEWCRWHVCQYQGATLKVRNAMLGACELNFPIGGHETVYCWFKDMGPILADQRAILLEFAVFEG